MIENLVKEIIEEIRERGGFMNAHDMELTLTRILSTKIPPLIKAERLACAMIMENWAKVNDQAQRDYEAAIMREGARAIRALDS